jgi:hypothetical protein
MARRIAIAALLIGLLIFLPPLINLRRFQTSIAQSISGAVSRQVTFSDVRLRLLPQPGFVFSDFVVGEDPHFGLEPMLRAEQVTARLRLMSLWRGRLEISRLSFDTASLNLVRDPRGRWNVVTSLQQASTVPVAPTAEPRAQAAPRFPYIEATDSRVNFKFGPVKQSFSLVDSNFSLWLDSPNHWQMRLEAQPVRTDAYLGDTGTIQASASFSREHNEHLEQVPFKAALRWKNAQLGQMTWLLTGKDRGWRADVDLNADAVGIPSNFHLRTRTSLDGFRRYDIAIADALRGAPSCETNIVRQAAGEVMRFSAESLNCELQVGAGKIAAMGRASWADREYDLTLTATDLPLQSIVDFYRRAKLNVSDSLRGSGNLQAELHVSNRDDCPSGTLRLQDARFIDEARKLDLPFAIEMKTRTIATKIPASCFLTDGATVNMGARTPLTVVPYWATYWGQRQFAFQVSGEAESDRLLATLKSFGLLTRDYHASGVLTLNAALVGSPAGFAYPQWTGTAQSAELTLPQGITLRNASVVLKGDTVTLQQFTTFLPDLQTTLSGSISWPVRCAASPCAVSFTVRASSLDLDTLNRAFNPAFRKRNWLYLPKFLGGEEAKQLPVSLLFAFNGNGMLQTDRLTVRKLELTNFTTNVEWHDRQIVLTNAHGTALGADVSGRTTLDFTVQPQVTGEISVKNLELANSTSLLSTQFARGKAMASASFGFDGLSATQIAQSFTADIKFVVDHGILYRFARSGDLVFTTWKGQAQIADRRLTILRSSLATPKGEITLTGNVMADQRLDLRMNGPSEAAISGTLSAPVVTATAAQAYSASNQQDAPKQAKTPH